MRKIKLNFSHLTITDKIAKARQIVAAIKGHPAFANPIPALDLVTAQIDDLETSHAETLAARQAAKTKTSARSHREVALTKTISQLVAYVESVGGDDEELLMSAGLDTRAIASLSSETPVLPGGLETAAGDHEGEVKLFWDTVAGARSYAIQQSPDPPTATSWIHAGVSIKSRYTINSLTSGTRFWFRVAAIGTAGQSGWSDPATRLAP